MRRTPTSHAALGIRSHMPAPSRERQVPGHDTGRSRRTGLIAFLSVTGIWFLLPGRVQGAICNCPVDRGKA